MCIKILTAALLVCVVCIFASDLRADDRVRLSVPNDFDAPTLDLKARPADLTTETTLTHWRPRYWGGGYYGGGFYGGGVRYWGGWGGYYGGFYPRYYASYSPFYYGAYYPRYYGAYYPRFYYNYTPAYISYGSFYYPCANETATIQTIPGGTSAYPRVIDAPTMPLPMPGVKSGPEGTFEYDGGPRSPLPMPKADEGSATRVVPRKPMVVNELFVSATTPTTGKWVYPAYGETARRER